MKRTVGLLVAVTAATALVVGCRDGGDDAAPQPPRSSRAAVPTTLDHPAYAAVEDALRGPGNLVVCGRRPDAGDASGSYERRIFTLAAGACPSGEGAPNSGEVVVGAYDSMLIRDQTSAIDFDDRLAAWTYLQFVVSLSEAAPPEVVAGVETAMASLGAEKTYDERRGGG
jgi:hypothetical protein